MLNRLNFTRPVKRRTRAAEEPLADIIERQRARELFAVLTQTEIGVAPDGRFKFAMRPRYVGGAR